MNNQEILAKKHLGGIPVNNLVIPIIILLVIFHITIIILIVSINNDSTRNAVNMQRSGQYTQEATSLLAGSSLLSETSTNFVLMPQTEGGEFNMGPLAAYATELREPRRGSDVSARFQKYDVSEENRAHIEEAASCADSMMQSQLHAMALVTAVYPMPDSELLSTIPLPKLTKEEAGWSDEEKQARARQLVLGTDYAMNKQTVSSDVQACVGNLQKESGMLSAQAAGKIATLRILLWIVTISIILIFGFFFLVFYRQLIRPLRRSTQLITSDRPLNQHVGLRELRQMSLAYNNLLHRRDTLDGILRAAAETDALTSLPNRYAFQQYLVESDDEGYSLGILLFDVNFLKKTNDTMGHSAGDELLRQSADCISACFGVSGENNCFRLGGDEFAAVIRNPSVEDIEREIQRFILEQQRRNISISWGYALATELTNASLRDLMEMADQRMYEQKKAMHSSVT